VSKLKFNGFTLQLRSVENGNINAMGAIELASVPFREG
jgi:hypothetical protein